MNTFIIGSIISIFLYHSVNKFGVKTTFLEHGTFEGQGF